MTGLKNSRHASSWYLVSRPSERQVDDRRVHKVSVTAPGWIRRLGRAWLGVAGRVLNLGRRASLGLTMTGVIVSSLSSCGPRGNMTTSHHGDDSTIIVLRAGAAG